MTDIGESAVQRTVRMTKRLRTTLLLLTAAVLPPLCGSLRADVVHGDDVIVQGSLCSGDSNDCADGESFTGFGPSNFEVEVKLKDNNPSIGFEDTNSTGQWVIGLGSDNRLAVQSSAQEPLTIEEDAQSALVYLAGTGFVGIKTSVPNEDLQINSPTPAIRLDDTSTLGGQVDLDMNGHEFALQGDMGQEFANFSTLAPVNSLNLDQQGFVGVGTTAPESRLHVIGGARIEGDVSLGSSRKIKENVATADVQAILGRLTRLPIYTWSYSSDPAERSHIGPMAEDFGSAFAMRPDEAHLSLVDVSGVALASIQALEMRQRELMTRLATLEAAVAEREREIGVLKAALIEATETAAERSGQQAAR